MNTRPVRAPKLPADKLAAINAAFAGLTEKPNFSVMALNLGVHRDSLRLAWLWWETTKQPIPLPPEPASLPETPTKTDPEKTFQERRQIRELKAEREYLLKEQEANARLLKMFSFVNEAKMEIPEWVRRKPAQGNKASMAMTILSDLHLDERVNPAQVNYVNEYDREIATKRLHNYFQNVVELGFSTFSGIKYEGVIVNLLGDTFSGNIHEELKETNESTIFESLLYWADPICAGLKMLRDAYGRVSVPVTPGNHGRNSRKPVAKNRATDNFDWFFAHLCRKLLDREKGITFMIPEAADISYMVSERWRYLATHGDQFRGGSGISGVLSPLMIGDARKRKREQAVNRGYDYMIMGHWHTLQFLPGMVINGSTKGYDEYAFQSNFGYEQPQQAFWINDHKHGRTVCAPVWVRDKTEKWTGGENVG